MRSPGLFCLGHCDKCPSKSQLAFAKYPNLGECTTMLNYNASGSKYKFMTVHTSFTRRGICVIRTNDSTFKYSENITVGEACNG